MCIRDRENTALSNLTKNSDGKLTVEVPTNMKYEHLNIELFHKDKGYVGNIFDDLVPKELIEYEKQYLAS